MIDQDGFPVRGATLHHPDGSAELDDGGRFVIPRLDRTPFEVRFMVRPGTEMQRARIDPGAGEVVIRAADVPRIRGTLRLEDGRSLAGVPVHFGRKKSWNQTATDATGHFDVPANVIGNTVFVRTERARTDLGPVLPAHGRARLGEPLELVASGGVLLEGRVLDRDGRAVEGAQVELPLTLFEPVLTDREGRFTTIGAAGRETAMCIRTPSGGIAGDRFLPRVLTVPADTDGRLGDIRLESGAMLRGVLVDREGRAVPDVQVAFTYHASKRSLVATTDAEGRFSVGGLMAGPPGAFRLVRPPGATRGHMLFGDLGVTPGRIDTARLVRVPARLATGRCVEISGERARRWFRISVPGLGTSVGTRCALEDGTFTLWVPDRPSTLEANLRVDAKLRAYRTVRDLTDEDGADLGDVRVEDPYRP